VGNKLDSTKFRKICSTFLIFLFSIYGSLVDLFLYLKTPTTRLSLAAVAYDHIHVCVRGAHE